MPQKTQNGIFQRKSCGCFPVGVPTSYSSLHQSKSLHSKMQKVSEMEKVQQLLSQKLSKKGSRIQNRNCLTSKQYLKLLACPKRRPNTARFNQKINCTFKRNHTKVRGFSEINLAYLANPSKAHIFNTWRQFQNILTPKQIDRLSQLFYKAAPTIKQADFCFRKMKKRENILRFHRKNKRKAIKHDCDDDSHEFGRHISLMATKITAFLCCNKCMHLKNDQKKISSRIVYYLICKRKMDGCCKNYYFLNAINNASIFVTNLWEVLEKVSYNSSMSSTPTDEEKTEITDQRSLSSYVTEEESLSKGSEEDIFLNSISEKDETQTMSDELYEKPLKKMSQELSVTSSEKLLLAKTIKDEEKEVTVEEEFEEAIDLYEEKREKELDEDVSFTKQSEDAESNESQMSEFSLDKLIKIVSEYYDKQDNKSKLRVFSGDELPEVFYEDMMTNLKHLRTKEKDEKPETKLAREYQRKLTAYVKAVNPQAMNENACATIYSAANALAKQTVLLLKQENFNFVDEILERVENLESKEAPNVQEQEEIFEDASEELLLNDDYNKELDEIEKKDLVLSTESPRPGKRTSEIEDKILTEDDRQKSGPIKDEPQAFDEPLSSINDNEEKEKPLQIDEDEKQDVLVDIEDSLSDKKVLKQRKASVLEIITESEKDMLEIFKVEENKVITEEEMIDEINVNYHQEMEDFNFLKDAPEDYNAVPNYLQEKESIGKGSSLKMKDEENESIEGKSSIVGIDAEKLNIKYKINITPHGLGKICCASLKVWAQWIKDVADNNQNWWLWLLQTFKELHYMILILKGQVYNENGVSVTLNRKDWNYFVWKLNSDINEWCSYNRHIQELINSISEHFHNKHVHCCSLCEKEEYSAEEVDLSHLCSQLEEALDSVNYWRKWLNKLVKNVDSLTSALDDKSFIEVASSDILLAISKSMMKGNNQETSGKLSSSLYSITKL